MRGPEVRVVTSASIRACPKISLLPRHYRADGTCRCDEREEAKAGLVTATAEVAQAEAEVARAQAEVARARDRLREC